MLEKSYSGLISSLSDIVLETAFFIKFPFPCSSFLQLMIRILSCRYRVCTKTKMRPCQNEATCRKANANKTLLGRRMHIIRKSEEKWETSLGTLCLKWNSEAVLSHRCSRTTRATTLVMPESGLSRHGKILSNFPRLVNSFPLRQQRPQFLLYLNCSHRQLHPLVRQVQYFDYIFQQETSFFPLILQIEFLFLHSAFP